MKGFAIGIGIFAVALWGGAAFARDASTGMASGKRTHAPVNAAGPSSKAAAPSPQPIPYPNHGRTPRSTLGPQTGGGHRMGR